MFEQVRIKEEPADSCSAVNNAAIFPCLEENIKKEIKTEKESKDCITCGESLICSFPTHVKQEIPHFVSPKIEESENIHPNLKRSLSMESCHCPSPAPSTKEFKDNIRPTTPSLFSRPPKRNYRHPRAKTRYVSPWSPWQYNYNQSFQPRNPYQYVFNQIATNQAYGNVRTHYNYFNYRNYARDNYRCKWERKPLKKHEPLKVEEKPELSQPDILLLRMKTNEKSIQISREEDPIINSPIISEKGSLDVGNDQNQASECLVNNSSSSPISDEINKSSLSAVNERELESIEVVCEKFVVVADVIAADETFNSPEPQIEQEPIESFENSPENSTDLCQEDLNCSIEESNNKLDIIKVKSPEAVLDTEEFLEEVDWTDTEESGESAQPVTLGSKKKCLDDLDNEQDEFSDDSEENLKEFTNVREVISDEIFKEILDVQNEDEEELPSYMEKLEDFDEEVEDALLSINPPEELEISYHSSFDNDAHPGVELVLHESGDKSHHHGRDGHSMDCSSTHYESSRPLSHEEVMVVEEIEKPCSDVSVINEIVQDAEVSVLNHRKERKVCKRCFLKWRREKKQQYDVVFLGSKKNKAVPIIELK